MQIADKSGNAAYLIRQLYLKHLQDFEAALKADGALSKAAGSRSGHRLTDATAKPLDNYVAAAAELLAVLKEDGETAVFGLPLTLPLTEPSAPPV